MTPKAKNKSSKVRGLASLPAILLLGGVIVEISIAGLLLLFYLNNSIYGSRLADEALAVAQSGINDTIVQVILNKDLPSITNDTLPVGNGTATTNMSPGATTDKKVITTTGVVATRKRTIQAIVTVDEITGRVTIDSIKELE